MCKNNGHTYIDLHRQRKPNHPKFYSRTTLSKPNPTHLKINALIINDIPLSEAEAKILGVIEASQTHIKHSVTIVHKSKQFRKN